MGLPLTYSPAGQHSRARRCSGDKCEIDGVEIQPVEPIALLTRCNVAANGAVFKSARISGTISATVGVTVSATVGATVSECVAGEALYRLGRPARLSGIVPMSEQSGCMAPWK